MARRLAILAALLALSACWGGSPFFRSSDAVPAITDGTYRMTEPGSSAAEGEAITIKRQADDSLLIDGGEHPMRALTIPIGSTHPGLFIVQLQKAEQTNEGRAPKAIYMLLDTKGDSPRLTILPCDAETGAIVRKHGGSVTRDPQSAASCTFTSRTLLQQQMQAAANRPQNDQIELRKVMP